MFGRKSTSKAPERSPAKKSLAQFGLMGDDDDDDDDGNLDNEDALEAELLALTSGETPKQRKSSRPVMSQMELNQMIKDSMRDISSDEEFSSGEEDPALLAELQELQVKTNDANTDAVFSSATDSSSLRCTLIERLKMYETAEQNAKASNDTSKARRMARGISNLKDLIKRVDMGATVSEDDIPPAVSINVTKNTLTINKDDIPSAVSTDVTKNIPAVPPRPNHDEIFNISNNSTSSAPIVPPRTVKHGVPSSPDANDEPDPKMKPFSNEDHSEYRRVEPSVTKSIPSEVGNLDILKRRQNEYKKAALDAKRRGDVQTALNYVKTVKHLEGMMQEAADKPIDLTSIPPSPDNNSAIKLSAAPIERDDIKPQHDDLLNSSDDTPRSPTVTAPATESYTPPATVMEALEERLKKYQEVEEAARLEENASKVRRMGRIVQQYKSAIQMHRAGKPIPVDELPTPPGFAPIPVDEPPKKDLPSAPSESKTGPPSVAVSNSSKTITQKVVPQRDQPSSRALSRSEKQMHLLMERQKIFKVSALKAKQEGNLDQAKEFLKFAKGFDPLIEASKCGLPVDLSSLPLPPNEKQALESALDSSNEVVRLNDCIEGTDLDVFHKLIGDLQHQLEMCMNTRDHFKAMGDVANANRLEQLALQTKKDLKFVQLAEMSNLRVPKFHYETKPFTIVQCNTDLTDNDLEVTVVQGINYNVPNPKAVDTYVKIYFPYPTENSQQYKTAVIYDTNNPSYNSTTTFAIQRNARSCKRIFMRNALKCEIWSKNGIFRSDSLIGTVNVKLQPLETQCTLHDAYDLMDGRRAVGGKLELKIRIRDPILKKQVEHIEEKWLIIDS